MKKFTKKKLKNNNGAAVFKNYLVTLLEAIKQNEYRYKKLKNLKRSFALSVLTGELTSFPKQMKKLRSKVSGKIF